MPGPTHFFQIQYVYQRIIHIYFLHPGEVFDTVQWLLHVRLSVFPQTELIQKSVFGFSPVCLG